MIAHQPATNALETWVRRSLASRYEPVLQEALPQEWLDLLKPPARN